MMPSAGRLVDILAAWTETWMRWFSIRVTKTLLHMNMSSRHCSPSSFFRTTQSLDYSICSCGHVFVKHIILHP